MNRKRKNITLANIIPPVRRVRSAPGAGDHGPGRSQPPKKSVTTIADTVAMLAYSEMGNIENFIALYSV